MSDDERDDDEMEFFDNCERCGLRASCTQHFGLCDLARTSDGSGS